MEGVRTATLLKSWSSSIYLHWGPGHPPAERGPSLESIYRASLTVYLCEGNKISSLKKITSPQPVGDPQKEKKIRGLVPIG